MDRDEALGRLEQEGVVAPALMRAPTVASIRPERVKWLWQDRIPLAKLSTLDGDPNLGKSTISLDVTARVSTGTPFPDSDTSRVPADVVILSAEDGIADTIRPRLEAAGAALARVHVLESVRSSAESDFRPPELPGDLVQLEALIREKDAALAVVDPFVAFLSSSVDSHRDQDVRRALYALSEMAERTGAAVVLVRHLNKGHGSNPLYRGGGSIGIIGAARAGMIVAPDPSDDSRRILAMSKSNLAPEAPALAYRIVGDEIHGCARVKWEGATTHKARELLRDGDDDERGALGEAMEFLRDLLAEGPVASKDAHKRAADAGVEKRTLRRARERLGVKPYKVGAPGTDEQRWEWALPEVDQETPEDAEGVHHSETAPSEAAPEDASKKTGSTSAPSGPDGQLRGADPSRSEPAMSVEEVATALDADIIDDDGWRYDAEVEPCEYCTFPCTMRSPKGRCVHRSCIEKART